MGIKFYHCLIILLLGVSSTAILADETPFENGGTRIDSVYHLMERARSLANEEHLDSAVAIAAEAFALIEDGAPVDDSVLVSVYNDYGHCLYAKRRFDEAGDMWRKALTIREGMSAPTDSLLAVIYLNLGRLAFSQRRLEEADSLIRLAGDVRAGLYGEDHPSVANCTFTRATVVAALGDHETAETMYLDGLAKLKLTYGDTHVKIGRRTRDLASYYDEMGRYAEADSLQHEVLRIYRQELGPHDINVAKALNSLGVNAYKTGRLAEADSLHRESLALLKQAGIGDHPAVIRTLNNLSNVHLALSNFDEAEKIYIRCLEMTARVYGEHNQQYERSLVNLAAVYHETAQYDRAEQLYNNARYLAEELFGPECGDIAMVEANLASIYVETGRYDLAEEMYRHSCDIFKRVFGVNHPYYASNLYNLAIMYDSHGRYLEAIPLLNQTLAIQEKIAGRDHPFTAQIMQVLAGAYANMGRYDESREMYEQALDMKRRVLGDENADVAKNLTGLGVLMKYLGDYVEAEKLHRQAWAMQKKIYSRDNRFTAQSIGNVASMLYMQGKYAEAESLFTQAALIMEDELGPEQHDIANLWDGLACCVSAQGGLNRADTLHMRALYIREQVYGSRHPNVAKNMMDMAELYVAMGDYERSLAVYRRFLTLRQDFIRYAFSYSSEEQKLRWLKRYPLTAPSLFSLALAGSDTAATHLALEMILRAKAIVLDAVMAEKKAAFCTYNATVRDMLSRRADICTEIATLSLAHDKPEAVRDSLERLYAFQDSLESDISHVCSPFRDELLSYHFQTSEIAAALPEDAVLWEFVKYKPYDFERYGNDEQKYGPERYLVFVLSPNGKVDLTDLGEASLIDDLITAARKMLYDTGGRANSAMSAEYERRLQDVTQQLHALLFAPLQDYAEGRTAIFISPDGAINLMPFEILPDDSGQYVIETYRTCYLASGRDLLKFKQPAVETNEVILIADPDFELAGITSEELANETSAENIVNADLILANPLRGAVDCLGREFLPLRYGRQETTAITRICSDMGKLTVREYYDRQAREEVLKQLDSPPEILHIVTHGFCCSSSLEATYNLLQHPLLRSGLVFAGANRTIRGTTRTGSLDEDGILSAFELSGLNLSGTQLVVLSACESGVGETFTGEGVFGIRRAFQHAGSESILMSLLKVPDRETSVLMEGFYRRWLGGMSKRDALRQSALEILRNCREKRGHGHPLLWGGFVLAGNPE
jgi:CHAT domain-containing protein/Tfp pilus assembly protein PilF